MHEDVEEYGLGAQTILTSTFNNSGVITILDAPALNITALETFTHSLYPQGIQYRGDGSTFNTYSLDPRTMAFTTESNKNDTFDAVYLEEHGTCQSMNDYRWGFSFLLLFISVLLSVLWVLGMHIMWLDAYFASHYDYAHRSMGTHRAALDFVSAMIKDMGDEAPSEDLSEKELIRRRKKAFNGGNIPCLNSISATGGEGVQKPKTRTEELRGWLNHRKWGRTLREFKSSVITLLIFGIGVVIAMIFIFSPLACLMTRCNYRSR